MLTVLGCDKPKPADETNLRVETPEGKTPEGKTPEGKAPEKPAEGGGDDVAKVEATRAAAKKKLAATPEEIRERARSLMAAVNEGRALVKKGELEQAIGKYKAALTIDPHFRPALGELGWAEFKGERYGEAYAHTLLALGQASTDGQRGAFLYNLGRVAEARGQVDQAIARYQQSLAVRTNATVKTRLDGLVASHEGPVADATSNRGLEVIATGPTLDAACKAIAGNSECADGGPCTLDDQPTGSSDFGILNWSDIGIVSCHHPVVKTKAGWTIFASAAIGQVGSEIDQGIDAVATSVETNAAGSFFVIRIEDHMYDRHWAGWMTEEELAAEGLDDLQLTFVDSEKVVFCRADDVAGAACTTALTTKFKESQDGRADDVTYASTISLEGDTVVVGAVKATPGFEFSSVAGEAPQYSWDESLHLPQGRYAFDGLARRAP
ncbi:MAG: tetratricopeptide repeat protein [Deltaproteobacteria bacterium]|nr:tetratricopeptide repeat protein [Deltaproteobacteria bacterium]